MKKTRYDESDFRFFREKYLNTSLLTMRMAKCKILHEKLGFHGLILIKSPPGSGKTFMAKLLTFYCEQILHEEKIKVSYINCQSDNKDVFLKDIKNFLLQDWDFL